MAKRFFEGTQHAARYALTRPSYPPILMQKIIDFLAIKYKDAFDYAADIGCGSGQSTELLSPYFRKVYGYDVSENQIKEAQMKNRLSNIEYKVSSNNVILHENKSLCLVTAAQAAHWFDLKQFYSEVDRTLKPMGVLALYGYGLVQFDGEESSKLNKIIGNFYQKLLPYFPPDRVHIDNKYANIILPYEEKIRDETVKIQYEWNLNHFLTYISTWSGYVHYMKKYPDRDIILDLRERYRIMLTYEDIRIGQNVEVLKDQNILYGKVLYKGPVVGRRGMWLGIDLATPDGDNNGCVKGRVYFRAPLKHGMFTTIDFVRLGSNFRRTSSFVYRTVNKQSVVEEELFGNTDPTTLPAPTSNATIPNTKLKLTLENPRLRPKSSQFYPEQQRYSRPQSLAQQMDEKLKKQRAKESSMSTTSLTNTTQYSFSPTPSIPRVFMPPSEVDNAKRTGFSGMRIPRYTVVYDQYDSHE